jgi:predicted transcriptional regulator of viral defense system
LSFSWSSVATSRSPSIPATGNSFTSTVSPSLQRRGQLQKVGRGLYIASETHLTEHHSLVEACKRVPRGIICLLSALRFHGLTTQAPSEVWMAIDDKAWRPKVDNPRLHVVRFSGDALTSGIEDHVIEKVHVRVYGPAKTVADCFKYRNKIGLDVALEALRDCWRHRRATMDELCVHRHGRVETGWF